MSRDRALQLAPASLALLLCKAEGGSGDAERGSRVFQDFQAANAKCFWNRRLVRAVAEVSFQGWLESWVLLLQGHPTNLEVLRDAWVRRALRPPRGFTISALGDVSPVQMSPVSQSQFIPLAEVLCCAISDMNEAQILVTQESLLEQLIKHHPGIATPTQEILYSTLGTLIKERKIYHTGEGYFIVTPQTYYITRKSFSHKCGAAEDLSASPPAVTYLVSMESCADLTKVNAPSVSHCRSCSCFSENSTQNILGQQSINESTVKEHKSVKDSKPSVQNQATSTSRDHHTCAKAKTQQLSLKEKEKCSKKFGISLFWRNVAKKEKSKKELVSFSAQFPPEEWPVRDEDNLDNIPRDLEHEIIKRINPVLTVDNLMKHTLMMQRLEEQKKYFSKGTSTDILKNKNGHTGKSSSRKKNGKMSKYHKKIQASKEKSKKDPCGQRLSIHVEADVVKKSGHPTNRIDGILDPDVFTPANADTDKHEVIYKKQIQNPFEGIPYRDNANVGHKSLKEIKRASTGKHRNNMPRSKSLDCPGSNPDAEARHLKTERTVDDYYNEELFQDQLVPNTDKDDLREYPSDYPECSTLRIEDKFKQTKEQNSMFGFSDEGATSLFGEPNVVLKADVTWDHDRGKSYSSGHYCGKIPIVNGPLQRGQINHCKNINSLKGFGRSYVSSLEEAESEKIGCYTARGVKDPQQYSAYNSSQMEEDTENNQICYKNVVDHVDVSSSLIEGDTDEHLPMCNNLDMHMQNVSMDIFDWNHVHEESHSASDTSPSHWELKRSPLLQFASSVNRNPEDCTHSVFSGSSKSYSKPVLHMKASPGQPLSQYLLNRTEAEVDAAECTQAAELVDGSIFDYCNSSECNSMAETVQTSIKGSDEKHAEDPEQQPAEMRKCCERSLTLFNAKSSPRENNQNENHSITGDSGIESPRTRISLASSNSVILETLKKRTFLQNLDMNASNNNADGLLSANTLMQLTPAMNV